MNDNRAIVHVLNDDAMEAIASIYLPKDAEVPSMIMLENDGGFYYYDLVKTVQPAGDEK